MGLIDDWSDDDLKALGHMVVAFAAVDDLAGLMLTGLIGRQLGTLLIAGEDLRWRLDKLEALSKEDLLQDAGVSQSLVDWVKNLRLLVDRRNHLIHSLYTVGPNKEIVRFKMTTRGGKWKGQQETMTSETFRDIGLLLTEAYSVGTEALHQIMGTAAWVIDLD